ncbi:cobalamin-5'-phosphate synthase [Halomicrobium zhouii]|uniref:Adenosylcobinamide-GDP ribazoletransferase n=1 Tax=Halomicrobium zhouii TaxID=767519 RepID=A0A1I6L7G9_9EURY|nr:adenosylcobinamide-GDP ribazoletransferase [Halomicrobium zhouii]SFR99425.1 cobalamin-5'-phosphate synthase [Halomicrobium zhouii]
MVLRAIRGALGFLTRLPVGRDEAALDAFQHRPVAFPLAGYVVGALLALPFVLGLPATATAFLFLAWVVLITGVNHADGLADLGDAAVVHGDAADRRDVMKDTTVGVGAVLAVGTGLLGLALAGLGLAELPVLTAVGVVVAAEVGAKLAVALLVVTGEPSHEGFGSRFVDRAASGDRPLLALVALPALLAPGSIPVGVACLSAALAVSVLVHRWADRRLGGVGGDVFGATNELARVVALHAGVVAWTLW